MRTILNRWYVAAAIGLLAGLVLGSVVGTAMRWDLHLYMRFVGVLTVTALAAVVASVYQTFLGTKAEPVVEEMEAESPS
jgi:hypothetical protein